MLRYRLENRKLFYNVLSLYPVLTLLTGLYLYSSIMVLAHPATSTAEARGYAYLAIAVAVLEVLILLWAYFRKTVVEVSEHKISIRTTMSLLRREKVIERSKLARAFCEEEGVEVFRFLPIPTYCVMGNLTDGHTTEIAPGLASLEKATEVVRQLNISPAHRA